MPLRPRLASASRTCSYNPGTTNLVLCTGHMQVHGDDVGCGRPSVATWSRTPVPVQRTNVYSSSQPPRDFTWSPSQGIKFGQPLSVRPCPTNDASSRMLSTLKNVKQKKLSLPAASTGTSNNAAQSSVPILPYIPRKPTTDHMALSELKQDQYIVEYSFPSLGNESDKLAQALNNAGVGQHGGSDQTWNIWEPIKFVSDASPAITDGVFLDEIKSEKRKRIAARLKKDLEEAGQIAAKRDKYLQEARQVAIQRVKQVRTIAKEQEKRARQLDTEPDAEVKELERPQVKGLNKPRDKKRKRTQAKESKTPQTTSEVERGLDFLTWREVADRKSMMLNKIQKAEQEAAVARALRSRVEASYRVKLLSLIYQAIKEPFAIVFKGYTDLIRSLRFYEAEHPSLVVGLADAFFSMNIDLQVHAHRYREIVRIRIAIQLAVTLEGRPPTRNPLRLRLRIREHYVNSLFQEQNHYLAVSIREMSTVDRERQARGLRPLFKEKKAKLMANSNRIGEAARLFSAAVKDKDAIVSSWAGQDVRRTFNLTGIIIYKFASILDNLRSLVRFWIIYNNKHGGIFRTHARLQLRDFSKYLEQTQSTLRDAIDEALEALEKQVEKQEAMRDMALGPQVLIPRQQQALMLHPSASLQAASFVRSSNPQIELQSSCGSFFELATQRTLATKDQDSFSSQAGEEWPCPTEAQSAVAFHIPEKVRREAEVPSTDGGKTYWQYTLYRGPEGEEVTVHYCKSKETSERIAKLFCDKTLVGFDIEWKPQASAIEGIKKNVSLIQLASAERIALFHIARYGKCETIDDLVAPTLKKIMESSNITKVGVAVKADCTRLRKFMGIDSRGLLELSHLYKLVKFSSTDVKKINKSLVALAQQVKEHLGFPMWKGEVRSSDWSEELNFEQVQCKWQFTALRFDKLILEQTLLQTRMLDSTCTMLWRLNVGPLSLRLPARHMQS